MEERIGKENSRPAETVVNGRDKCVSEENTVTSIPLVVEVDLVDVDFELTIVIPPHVEVVTVVDSSHLGHCVIKHMNRCIVCGTSKSTS